MIDELTTIVDLCSRLKKDSPLSQQEEGSKPGRDDRSSVAAILAERKMDSSSSSAAANNNNKVKVMATQLLAKFEENAPAHQSGLKRQVGQSYSYCVLQPGCDPGSSQGEYY